MTKELNFEAFSRLILIIISIEVQVIKCIFEKVVLHRFKEFPRLQDDQKWVTAKSSPSFCAVPGRATGDWVM